jgi:lysozyme
VRLFFWVLGFFAAIQITNSFAQQDNQDNTGYDYSRSELFSIIRTLIPGTDPFALQRNFVFPDNARDNSTFIVDFSHHVEDACRCELDWGKVADNKVKAVYLKATQGKGFTDPSLKSNLKALASISRLDVGVYHFLTATDEAQDQTTYFLSVLKEAGALQLPASLDLEWHPGPMRDDCPNDAIIIIRKSNGDVTRKCDLWGFMTADAIIARAKVWLDAAKAATGKEPVLYTSDAWLKPRLGDDTRIKELHTQLIWIADYSKGGLATEMNRPGFAGGHLV